MNPVNCITLTSCVNQMHSTDGLPPHQYAMIIYCLECRLETVVLQTTEIGSDGLSYRIRLKIVKNCRLILAV